MDENDLEEIRDAIEILSRGLIATNNISKEERQKISESIDGLGKRIAALESRLDIDESQIKKGYMFG